MIGLLAGAGLGLLAGIANWVFFVKIEENAIKGLDKDAVEAKRDMYGKLRIGVLAVEVVMFAAIGYLAGDAVFG